MKRSIHQFLSALLLILFLLVPDSAWAAAKDMIITSAVTGLSLLAPAKSQTVQDDLDMLFVKTLDGFYSFTGIPFNAAGVSEEEISNSIASLAQSAQMDLKNAEKFDTKTQTMDISIFVKDYENGGGSMVGTATVRDTNLSFYIVLIAGRQYGDYGGILLQSLELDLDSLKK